MARFQRCGISERFRLYCISADNVFALVTSNNVFRRCHFFSAVDNFTVVTYQLTMFFAVVTYQLAMLSLLSHIRWLCFSVWSHQLTIIFLWSHYYFLLLLVLYVMHSSTYLQNLHIMIRYRMVFFWHAHSIYWPFHFCPWQHISL